MRGLMHRFNVALGRAWRFAGDVRFFWWDLRYSFRDALAKARDTIY